MTQTVYVTVARYAHDNSATTSAALTADSCIAGLLPMAETDQHDYISRVVRELGPDSTALVYTDGDLYVRVDRHTV